MSSQKFWAGEKVRLKPGPGKDLIDSLLVRTVIYIASNGVNCQWVDLRVSSQPQFGPFKATELELVPKDALQNLPDEDEPSGVISLL